MDETPTDNNQSSSDRTTRRTFLAGATVSTTAMLAGCIGGDEDDDSGLLGGGGSVSGESNGSNGGIVQHSNPNYLSGRDRGKYVDEDLSGGSEFSIEQDFTMPDGYRDDSWDGHLFQDDVGLVFSRDWIKRFDKDGTVWRKDIQVSYSGGPFIIDDLVYVRSDNQMYVYDVESGDREDLYEADKVPRAFSDHRRTTGLVYDGEYLYGVESEGSGEDRFIQYDIAADERVWEEVISNRENSQNAFAMDNQNDKLYTFQGVGTIGNAAIGIYDKNAGEFNDFELDVNTGRNSSEYLRGNYLVMRENDSVTVVDIEAEEILWREDDYEMDVLDETNFAVDSEKFYRRIDGGIGAYEIETGDQVWSTQLPGGRIRDAATTGGELLVRSSSDELFMYDAQSGDELAHTDDDRIGSIRHMVVQQGSIWGLLPGFTLAEITV